MKSDVLTYGPGLALPRSGRNRAAVKTKRGALARVCWQPYVYLLPALVLMCVWIYYPLLRTFYLSFFNWNMLPTTTPQFCGLDNFAKLLRTPGFSNAVINTLVMMVGLLPFSIVLPVLVSIFAKSITKRASAFYRGMIFVPMILAPVAAAAVFRWILHPAGGLLNQLLERMGVEESISFLNDPRYALGCIIFITGWKMTGFFTLLFYSAVQNIDDGYYQAAAMDGAGFWQQTFRITLPLLSPTLVFNTMLSILFASSWSFTYVDTLTQGGPLNSTINAYYFMWDKGFRTSSSGLTSSSAVVFFLGFGLIALVLSHVGQKLSYYDN